MNYEDMSDFEINKAVAVVTGQVGKIGLVKVSNGKITDSSSIVKNYCNKPSDAWSIIVENKISIAFGSELTTVRLFTCTSAFEVIDKNPLRAAMICFLKMKDAQNKPCKKSLADGQWYKFCGEFDMDSAPALCVNCGGEFKLKDAEK